MNHPSTTVDSACFQSAVAAAARAITKNNTRPVLNLMRISVDLDGYAYAEGRTKELCIEGHAPSLEKDRRTTPGTILVEHARLLKWLKLLGRSSSDPKLEVDITNQGDTLTLQAYGGRTLELPAVMSPDEWPTAPTRSSRKQKIPAPALARALGQVIPAVAKAPGRYAMHGALLELGGAQLKLTGTDGRRLHCVAVPVDGGSETATVIVERAALVHVHALAKAQGARGQAALSLAGEHEDWTTFHLGRCQVSTRTLVGEFPRYSAVLPSSYDAHAGPINVKAAVKALKLVGVAANLESPAVRLAPTTGVGVQIIAATGPADGGCIASAVVAAPKTQALTDVTRKGFNVNPTYLQEAMEAADAEEVTIQWTDGKSPLEVVAEGFRGVVMPITIDIPAKG